MLPKRKPLLIVEKNKSKTYVALSPRASDVLPHELGAVHVADGTRCRVLLSEAHEGEALVGKVTHVEDLPESVEQLTHFVV